MTDLPTFNPNARCPKCANDDIHSGWTDGEWPHGAFPRCRLAGEHIHRTCRRCQYGWVEAPLDARPVSPPSEGAPSPATGDET